MTSKVNSFLLAGIWLTDSLSGGCVGGQEDEVEEIKTRQLCCYRFPVDPGLLVGVIFVPAFSLVSE